MATQMSSREFNQDTSGAKKAAERGPVYITDRGRPAHVLLTFDAYEELIAELCSSIMAHELGIDDEGTNTAKYLESWLKALRSEDGPKLLYKAASDAQKAANHLIKVTASQEVAA